jgi:hypothetical protein
MALPKYDLTCFQLSRGEIRKIQMLNLRAAGKIYREFTFLLIGNLHDANGRATRAKALQFARGSSLSKRSAMMPVINHSVPIERRTVDGLSLFCDFAL